MNKIIKPYLLITFLFIYTISVAQQKYSLVIKNSEASCLELGLLNEKKQELNLPADVAFALKCPMIANIHDSILTYSDTSSVKQYNIADNKIAKLFSLPSHCDGVSGPCWSRSFRKAMFVIVNQEQSNGFEASCRIVMISFDEKGQVVKRQHYDRPVNFECGSFCSAEPGIDYDFVKEDVIKFRRHLEINERPGQWETINLDQN